MPPEVKQVLPTFVGDMFVEDEETGELKVNKRFIEPPQKQIYGGKTPEERWGLEHDPENNYWDS